METQEHEVELIDYLRVLWRQKWVIAVTFLVAVAAAYGASRAMSPTYQTKTSLLLLPPLSSELNAEPVGSRLAPEAYQELAVSTSLLQAVMDELALPQEVSIEDLKKRFTVSVKRLSSEGELLLTASIRGTNPERLPGIAAAWTESFTSIYGELFQDRTARSYSYISENYAATQEELQALTDERTAFLAENPVEILRAEALVLQDVLTSNSKTLLEARQELEAAEAYLAARGSGRTALPTYVLTSDLDPNTLAGALAFGLSAEAFRALGEARIANLEQSTENIAAELAAKQQTIETAQASLSELDRRIRLLENAHASLAAKLQDAKIALAETPEPIRVIDEPLVPEHPIAPRKTTNIAIAGFLGLLVGTLLGFFVDYLSRVHQEEAAAQAAVSRPLEQPHVQHADDIARPRGAEQNEDPHA